MVDPSDRVKRGAYAVAAILLLTGVLLVTAGDDPPDGPQEFEFEEEADAGPGDVDLTWWAGAGAMVLGVLVAAWAWRGDRQDDDLVEDDEF